MLSQFPKSLLRASASSLLVRVSGMGLAAVVAILLARMLGPEQFGAYSYVLSVVTIVAIPASMGMPSLLIRETARYLKSGDIAMMRHIWRWAHQWTAILVAAIWALGGVFVLVFGTGEIPLMALIWGGVLVALTALSALRRAALHGLGYVIRGQFPDFIVYPCVLIASLVGFMLFADMAPSSSNALMLNCGAAVSAFLLGTLWLVRRVPTDFQSAATPIAAKRSWLMSAGILGVSLGLTALNSNLDMIMLGIIRSDAEVGVYRTAVITSEVAALGLMAVNAVIMPSVARLCESGDRASLQRLTTSSARLILLFTAIASSLLLLTGEWILETLFGVQFAAAYSALSILLIGQIANAAFGSVALLLNMSGYEKDTLAGLAVSSVSNIALNALLIPSYGGEGAAIATASALFIWNFFLWRRVKQRLCVNSMAVRIL